MNRPKQKIISFILRHPLRVIGLIFLLIIPAAVVVPRINIDNSVEAFFDKSSTTYKDFQEWKTQFGSDEIIVVAFSDKDIFTRENLSLIKHLTERLESLPSVDTVTSLTNVNNIIGAENDFIVEDLVEEIPDRPVNMGRIKAEALNNPLYVDNVISRDGRTTALLVELEGRATEDDVYLKDAMEGLDRVLKQEMPQGRSYYISGLTAISYYFAHYMQNDLKTYLPFMFLVIIAVLYFSFRQIKIIILPLIAIAVSLILSMAFLYILGYSINNVTTVIPPILMAIMIADSVHLLGETVQKRRAVQDAQIDSSGLLSGSMRHLFGPCFLTTLTTSIGFLSLCLSRVPPVKELGLVVGAGVFIALVLTFTLLPALAQQMKTFRLAEKKGPSGEKRGSRFLDKGLKALGRFNEKRKYFILAGTLVLIVVCVGGVSRIKVETSTLEFFRKNSPVYLSTVFIEDNLSGIHTLNISFQADTPDYFKSPEVLKEIETFHGFLSTIPEVDKVTSVVDYLKEINKSFHNEDEFFYVLPESKNLTAQYVLLYSQDDLEDFVDSLWQWTTVRVRLREHNTNKLKSIITQVQQYIQKKNKILPQGKVLGQTVLETETNNAVTSGQLKSLGLAMVIIFLMMFVVFRSIPVGLISIVPNALPILMNFGLMGYAGIRLDSATSMIAAIGIGIVVDDTIHYLHAYGEHFKTNNDHSAAMRHSLTQKGRPIIFTSVILFCGFGIVSASNFMPTSWFGLLSALLMVNALLADLIILPALLLVFRPRFSQKKIEIKR